MKKIRNDMENIKKFLDDLGYCKVCISDIQTRIDRESFESNEEILEEIGRVSDFLVDAENHLKKTMES